MQLILTEETLPIYLQKWQQILGLQDWDIKAHIKRQHEFSENCRAMIEPQHANKQALLYIIDAVDYPSHDFDNDQEQALVHELLHILFNIFEPDENSDPTKYMLWHQTLDFMATLLVAQNRSHSSI